MINKFSNFQEKRMYIFGELVKRYWKGELNNVKDLNNLALDIKDQYGFSDEDLPFIKDHIRIAMGIDPKGEHDFNDELYIVKSGKKVNKPVVAKIDGVCRYCNEEKCKCDEVCKYEVHIYRRTGDLIIEDDKCLSCGECVTACDFGALADKIEFLPVIDMLKNKDIDVYAVVAPAIVGQFGKDISMGQLRTALKYMGFKDMIEVALFADILTIKEAYEFSNLVKTKEDFFLTSCCCPVWFNLTKKHYPNIFKYMSPSVSPMIASGRILKKLYNNIKVVFIAPCIAKKAEIKEKELEGAIDFVLNFRELAEIFKALDIDLKSLPSEDKDHASYGGRIYARTGGVSFSVKSVVNRLEPMRLIQLKAKRVDGVKGCKEVLELLSNNKEFDYNFIEGMGCEGGCVGGPRTIIDKEEATFLVNKFGEDSYIMTPLDNLNIMKILREIGAEDYEDILKNKIISTLLSRE